MLHDCLKKAWVQTAWMQTAWAQTAWVQTRHVPGTVGVGRLLGPVASDRVERAHVTLVVPLRPAPRLIRTIEVALLLYRRPHANLLATMLAVFEVTDTPEGSFCPQALHCCCCLKKARLLVQGNRKAANLKWPALVHLYSNQQL